MSGLKKSVIRNMELLVIDEVSMLRADLLDAMDYMMQTVRKNTNLLVILLQLPPVIRDEEWRTLRNYYKGKFFFIRMPYSKVRHYTLSYLQYTVRLTPSLFLLNNLRNNQITAADVQALNKYVKPDLKNNKGYITLTTHNAKADAMNAQALEDLKGS
jgi:hypothetical protein